MILFSLIHKYTSFVNLKAISHILNNTSYEIFRIKTRKLKFNNINFSPISGVSRLRCDEKMLPPMLKSLSLSIDDDGDESILFATLPSSGNTFMFVFHQSIRSTSRGSNRSEPYFSSSFLSAFEDEEDCRRSFFVFPFSAFVAFHSADAIKSVKHESKSKRSALAPASSTC